MRNGTGMLALAGAVALTACADTAGPPRGGEVAVQFTAAAGATQGAATQNGSLVLTGTNGTLRIDELHVVVDDFELKRLDDDGCASGDSACEKFVAPPMLLDLRLDGGSTIAVRQNVDPDTYRRLKFEIDDVDDSDDPSRAQAIRTLQAAIRARFPDWPRDASMLVVGVFTPTAGAPQPFRAYFQAEVEVELRLEPPVTVQEGGTFTVELDAGVMFRTAAGAVRNLALLDYAVTGQAHEFRAEVRNSFMKVEFNR